MTEAERSLPFYGWESAWGEREPEMFIKMSDEAADPMPIIDLQLAVRRFVMEHPGPYNSKTLGQFRRDNELWDVYLSWIEWYAQRIAEEKQNAREIMVDASLNARKVIKKMIARQAVSEANASRKMVVKAEPHAPSEDEPDLEPLPPIMLSPLNSLKKGSAEPSISGVYVSETRVPSHDEVRAMHAIDSFMKINAGKVAESRLIHRLVGGGLSEAQARFYIKRACESGVLEDHARFYKTPSHGK